jgi:AAA+ superfamily predicted ATPase
VGEIRRVLNSFLQFLEQDDSQSLVLGATNHPQALDHALFRRFDDVIEYTLPPPELLETVVRNKLATFDLHEVDWALVMSAAEELSYADITQAAEAAAREVVLDDSIVIPSRVLVSALEERRTHRRS